MNKMTIPSNPKISDNVMAKFLSGDNPPISSQGSHTDKKAVKMYNVPFPPEVHRQAKINALNEGISLAEYLIRAIVEANERYSK